LDVFARNELGVFAYKSALADLNADGVDEIILRATDPSWCGSGGCTLFILAHERSSFRIITRTTITKLPIRLLASSTNGWRDLSVVVQGGGIMEAQVMKLSFDGNSYPSNPSMPLASRMSEPSGTILIR
jgi:hypothetical protein